MQAFIYEELGALGGILIVIGVAMIITRAYYGRPKP